MSKLEKAMIRLMLKPKDFTYQEIKMILNNFGFFENHKGKTSGSRVEFRDDLDRKIVLHKPHPNNILKEYQINKVLKEWRFIG